MLTIYYCNPPYDTTRLSKLPDEAKEMQVEGGKGKEFATLKHVAYDARDFRVSLPPIKGNVFSFQPPQPQLDQNRQYLWLYLHLQPPQPQ